MNRQREISELQRRQEDKMINHPYNYDTDTRSFRMVDNHIVNYGGSSMNNERISNIIREYKFLSHIMRSP